MISDDTAIVQSLLAHRLKLSLKVIEVAKTAAWNDLDHDDQRFYMKAAEIVVNKELGKVS